MSHYKPYPAYKNSGVEWLGLVPEHWDVKAIRWLSSVQRGASPRPIEDPKYFDDEGEYGWVRIEDVTAADGLLLNTKQRLSSLGANLSVKLQPGALFLSIAGSVGKPCIAGSKVCIHDGFVYFPMLRSHTEWLFKIFESRTPFIGLGKLGTQLNLNTETVSSIKVGLPPAGEALRILSSLDRETARIDALIEKKTRFIELLREKRQALITHTVTKGLDPNVKMKDSGVEWLGEVPEHWVVKRLKFIATVQTGIAKGKDNAEKDTVEVPYLRVANVQDGYLDLDEVATIEVSTAELPRYLLQPGDVLMNEGGDFDKLGRGHVWHGEIEPCIHQNHVFAVRPHGVNSEWLNTFTSSASAQFYFMARSKQSTNLASISSSNLMELAVPLPSEEEQRLILDRLHRQASQVNALLAQTERSIELLKERRAALITAAVTGQIDLREAV
jgi:type I restriction enzyme S subunit